VSPSPRTQVDTEVELRLVLPESGPVPLRVALRYAIEDPFAVTAAFQGDGVTIDWVFARDLLVGGLEGPCGEGDVHVWPSWAGGRDLVLLSLSSPDGQAVLEADASDLRVFIDRTLDLVPLGAESDHVDVDAQLLSLFG
jgi:hypothetical protein